MSFDFFKEHMDASNKKNQMHKQHISKQVFKLWLNEFSFIRLIFYEACMPRVWSLLQDTRDMCQSNQFTHINRSNKIGKDDQISKYVQINSLLSNTQSGQLKIEEMGKGLERSADVA